ncbi:MAG: FkbM family methyltransferase, partial [Saprospiraceae bacterium]
MSIRTKVIQAVVGLNEKIIFYPRLKQFYSSALSKSAPTILDVGSNKGQSVDFFLNIYPKATIYGFEPNTSLYQRLINRYRSRNQIQFKNLGVSSQEGTLLFHENIMDETSTFETLNKDSEYLKKKAKVLGVSTDTIIKDSYEVNVTTLDNFIDTIPEEFVDVLKIDVEGHEFDCLSGLFNGTRTHFPIRYIQLESHHDDMYLNSNHHKITQILNDNKFEE